MRFKVFFAWYNFWVGIYYDRKRRILYINPLPTLVFSFASDKNVWNEEMKRWELEYPRTCVKECRYSDKCVAYHEGYFCIYNREVWFNG